MKHECKCQKKLQKENEELKNLLHKVVVLLHKAVVVMEHYDIILKPEASNWFRKYINITNNRKMKAYD